MVKIPKGTTNGTCKQSNDLDLKNNQKRLKTSVESTDAWSVESLSDSSRISKERPVSHTSDEGKKKKNILLQQCYGGRNSYYLLKLSMT